MRISLAGGMNLDQFTSLALAVSGFNATFFCDRQKIPIYQHNF
jgi:hypothetical protein